MSCLPDMTPTSLVAFVASCTGKIIKNVLKDERICNKMVYYTFYLI